ncbi:MAG: ribosomal protein S18-alanine N-acetyltransferase [Clostridia bacterium]|nr:ribosomal protein S18-alanine N-acetyltransferase [Clostridia bacterium]
MEITEMSLDDLELMKDTLYSDFDNFWSYNVLKKELENEDTTYIVAKENDQVIGFAGIMICLDEATLNNIVVKKSYRGKGIGGELLDSLIDLCGELDIKSITLEVNVSNIPAINLYTKFGFKNMGIRKKYYNNSQDAIIMTKYDI